MTAKPLNTDDVSTATIWGARLKTRMETTYRWYGYWLDRQSAEKFIDEEAVNDPLEYDGDKLVSLQADWFEVEPLDWDGYETQFRVVHNPWGETDV